MEKKTYENERISIKNSLPYIKCVLRLSCVFHGPIYGRLMGCTVNGFLSILRFTKLGRQKQYSGIRSPMDQKKNGRNNEVTVLPRWP